MKDSLKQLFRTPAKALLFFFLMAVATALIAVGSALYSQSSQRIEEVEGSFTTLAMVKQVPLKTVTTIAPLNLCGFGGGPSWDEIWGDADSIDVLDFEGAEYLTPPENRPYYVADVPALNHAMQYDKATSEQVVQVTALEDSDPKTMSGKVRVEKVIATYDDGFSFSFGGVSSVMKEGKVFFFSQCNTRPRGIDPIPLQKGKQYIFSCYGGYCPDPKHSDDLQAEGLDSREYVITQGPYCRQYDKDGNELPTNYFTVNRRIGLIEEITEDFWVPGGKGETWEYWTHYREKGDHLFTVAPVDDLQLLPVFQSHKAYLAQGREITAEEFENGALVCMLPNSVFLSAELQLGDKISFSMLCSAYGAPGDNATIALWNWLSPFNAQGELYQPFWEADYEIVGTYDVAGLAAALEKEIIANEMVVLPAKSVQASDENNIAYYDKLKPAQASFLLPNGSIDAFETALHEALPDLEGLEITYNDNGYEEIMGSLRSAWITAILLLAVGLLSALATLLLLLYFFIIKQKKRTAIERSLGFSKHQCRISLISGIMVLTILSSAIGSAGAALLMSRFDLIGGTNTATIEKDTPSSVLAEDLTEDIEPAADAGEQEAHAEPTEAFSEFSTKFSLWASESNTVDYTGGDTAAPNALFFVIPLALTFIVLVLSLLLVNRNLKIEPIYLLSGKLET